jgi:signal transduction histidine kinase
VTVSDNGVGLQEERAEIQPFKTTSDLRYAGMGIGLTLARQILQAHQCDITLERGPRGGARVQFDLPSRKG